MFADSDTAGERAAAVCSLTGACGLSGINPCPYPLTIRSIASTNSSPSASTASYANRPERPLTPDRINPGVLAMTDRDRISPDLSGHHRRGVGIRCRDRLRLTQRH